MLDLTVSGAAKCTCRIVSQNGIAVALYKNLTMAKMPITLYPVEDVCTQAQWSSTFTTTSHQLEGEK